MKEYVYCISNVNILKYNKHGIQDVIVVYWWPKAIYSKEANVLHVAFVFLVVSLTRPPIALCKKKKWKKQGEKRREMNGKRKKRTEINVFDVYIRKDFTRERESIFKLSR